MRTSRVYGETARLVQALSPVKRSTRRSLGKTASTNRRDEAAQSQADFSGSDLSTPPSSPEDSTYGTESTTSLGKRKRGGLRTTSSNLKVETPATRHSPRKAPKPDPDDASRKARARRQPAKRIKGPNGDITVEPPSNWEQVYNITAEMRKRVLAPVDTMGCESLAEEKSNPRDKRLQTLIALMLSSQTKDTVTAAAMRNLQENLPGGCSLEALLDVEPAELNGLIGKVGFHNNKTKYIKAVAPLLRDNFNGDIPDTIDGLTSLPGVGPKMAYLCMSAAWGRDEGIGVDVHVHRITNLWGWHKTATPEQTRAELESWLPRDRWHAINHLLVGFGQTICLPVGRKCGECDLAREKLCPSVVAGSAKTRKTVVKREIKLDEGEGGGGIVDSGAIKIETDDVGVKIEADLDQEGQVEIQTSVGPVKPEIEEL